MSRRLLVSCLLPFVVAAACRPASRAPITLGAAGPWTEAYGAMNRRGIELAVEEINARRDRRSRPVRVLFRDDGGDGMRAAAIAQEFIDSAHVAAVIGHVSSGAMMAAARVYDGHLPAIATTASSPGLTGISRWTFRVISSDSANGVEIARFAMRLGRRRAAVLYEDNAYGRGLTDAFRRGFKGEIISADPIAEGSAQDLEPFVTYFSRMQPDLVFVAGTGASGLAFLREARRQGLKSTLIGGDGWSVLATDTTLAEGVYVGAPFTAEDQRPDARRFVERFRARYHLTPDGNAALAYDATMLLAAAVQRVGTDRRRVRDYLERLAADGGYQGVTGNIAFGPGGDPVGRSVVVAEIRHGALVLGDAR